MRTEDRVADCVYENHIVPNKDNRFYAIYKRWWKYSFWREKNFISITTVQLKSVQFSSVQWFVLTTDIHSIHNNFDFDYVRMSKNTNSTTSLFMSFVFSFFFCSLQGKQIVNFSSFLWRTSKLWIIQNRFVLDSWNGKKIILTTNAR